MVLLVGLTVAAGLWLGSWLIARRITWPLTELSQVAREIGEGKLDSRARLASEREDEVGRLARSINEMARRIERQLADQKELLAAVSHELRTPLGHLRVIVELARERGLTAEHIAKIEDEVREIDDLIDRVLASSRLDFSAIHASEIDVGALLASALERANLSDAGLIAEGSALSCSGDLNLLKRALANVIDNAIRHGGGVRSIGAEASTQHVELFVVDKGGGERATQFAEHWRGRHGRERASSAGGLGLGLSLVERIAKAHGGELLVAVLDTGSRVALRLPIRSIHPS
jgi:signal transduction histidine kinase